MRGALEIEGGTMATQCDARALALAFGCSALAVADGTVLLRAGAARRAAVCPTDPPAWNIGQDRFAWHAGCNARGAVRPSGFTVALEEKAMNRFRAWIASIVVLAAAPIAAPAAELARSAQSPASVSAATTDRPHCVTGRLPLDRRHRTCAGRSGRWW
jgi:hypothetical protein